MYGRVIGVTVLGVGGHPVTVEAFVGRGLPSLTVTGLPGAAVQDARDRIRPAVEHAELEWPLRRVVVNLAPGNLRKEGEQKAREAGCDDFDTKPIELGRLTEKMTALLARNASAQS